MLLSVFGIYRRSQASVATHGTAVSRFTPKTPQACTEQSYLWLSLFPVLLPFAPHWTQSPAHPYSPTMSLTPSIPLGSIAPNLFITVATGPQLCACVPNLKYLNPRCHLYQGFLCPRETSFELPQKSSLWLWSGPSQASSHSRTQDLWGCPSAGDSI